MTEESEPFNEMEAILTHFVSNEKPWKKKMYPKLYNWKSSIPDSWVKRHGKNRFKKSEYASGLRINAQNLNNSKEFLHTLSNFRTKTPEKQKKLKIKYKVKINLAELTKEFDLLHQNKYIAEKIEKRKQRSIRSQNSTPIKRK